MKHFDYVYSPTFEANLSDITYSPPLFSAISITFRLIPNSNLNYFSFTQCLILVIMTLKLLTYCTKYSFFYKISFSLIISIIFIIWLLFIFTTTAMNNIYKKTSYHKKIECIRSETSLRLYHSTRSVQHYFCLYHYRFTLTIVIF